MGTQPSEMWMVRAGRGGVYVEEFRSSGIVGVGDFELGEVPGGSDRATIKKLWEKHSPGETKGAIEAWTTQVNRIVNEIKQGDRVVTYDAAGRTYLIGEITGPYAFKADPVKELPHTRPVRWTREVSRDVLSVATRNTLGSTLALFRLPPEAAAELTKLASPIGAGAKVPAGDVAVRTTPSEVSDFERLRADTIERAEQFIEDRIASLSWENMQELIAGILRAMGYRTRVSPAGADRGVDIFASPDGLGLEEPRIFVEVKHRRGQKMGAAEIRSFLGGRKPGDRCLYVSTGGFAQDARYEAERANVPLTLIDLPLLRRLVVDRYESLDGETRALVPLVKFFWPA